MRRPLLILALIATLAALAGCGPKPAPRGGRGSSGSSSARASSARGVLVAYLDATFSGHHARGYSLLTRGDQARTSRAAYIEEQRNLAQMRAQMSSLGKMRRKVGPVTERNDRASATVVLTSGLGSEKMRFVLRRERGQWRVDYGASWASP